MHGDLLEDVYMKPPPGFVSPGDNRVCHLRKSLYGLKQAGRQWFHKLTTALLDFGFTQHLSDYSLFTLVRDGASLTLLVYVDDIVLAGPSMDLIS